jgi:hypothetical protein
MVSIVKLMRVGKFMCLQFQRFLPLSETYANTLLLRVGICSTSREHSYEPSQCRKLPPKATNCLFRIVRTISVLDL